MLHVPLVRHEAAGTLLSPLTIGVLNSLKLSSPAARGNRNGGSNRHWLASEFVAEQHQHSIPGSCFSYLLSSEGNSSH